ncbi:hypothetical protein BASA50_003935 [Batrachochytrium salamandrivorans]|uniref:CARDB domain-containing protein n=1 Tax=Batrachochytrium salamandrivorans TaxID=1357716 RepID=A0ABQ8FGR6_9FUNG|nr:hypothetical protein BASA50_003935 [Batrachochytrium salamandrivorans]KAH9272510.1 hypothetical protein BASA83_005319 [Batrachochytrium salamandrivorans]KAJ1340703.1 hypothetical protein BSLG_004797 [Batrachochytrium salamandrivorans]
MLSVHMMMSLLLLALSPAPDLATAQVTVAQTFSFVVTPVNFPPLGPVSAQTPSISLSWSTDSCAGAVDATGKLISGGSPSPILGSCRDAKGTPVSINLAAVFPAGLKTLSLRRGLSSNSTSTDLLPSVVNSAALAGNTRQVTITNLGRFPSDYYALSISAIDANGNLVRGQSQFFSIQNTGPLPTMAQIQLWSPLDGSYWLANAEYRVRWEMLQTSLVPDFFHLDLLTSDNLLAARLVESMPPNTGDTLLGAGRPLNYTVWNIDKALRNKRFKLRVTGVFVLNGVVQNITSANPMVESGVFFVGPAKPTLSGALAPFSLRLTMAIPLFLCLVMTIQF